MYFESQLEIDAIKSYHKDKWTDEDYALFGKRNPKKATQVGSEIEMQNFNEEYEGGHGDAEK
mgnify:CR=1 FL=1